MCNCSYDTRGQSHLEARHWSDEEVLGGRAFFRGDQDPARLVLDNVRPGDGGGYRCRVDFYRAPTTIESIVLDVIGECKQKYLMRSSSRLDRGNIGFFPGICI